MNDTVTLVIPARTENVALARTVAAAMAARADLPIDQLEDVRLAIDEAVSQLIGDATPGTDVTCAFTAVDGRLDVLVSGSSRSRRAPATDTFSWTVLRALVDSVSADVDGETVTLSILVTRAVAVEA